MQYEQPNYAITDRFQRLFYYFIAIISSNELNRFKFQNGRLWLLRDKNKSIQARLMPFGCAAHCVRVVVWCDNNFGLNFFTIGGKTCFALHYTLHTTDYRLHSTTRDGWLVCGTCGVSVSCRCRLVKMLLNTNYNLFGLHVSAILFPFSDSRTYCMDLP